MTTSGSLNTLLSTFLSSSERHRQTAFEELIRGLKAAIEEGLTTEAADTIRSAAIPMLDYSSAEKLHRLYTLVCEDAPSTVSTKLAVLGSVTASQLRKQIELFLYADGVDVEVYEADYGTYRQEILDSESELYGFRPDVVFLATSRRELGHAPNLNDRWDAVHEKVALERSDWSHLWELVHHRLGCQVVQNNFDAPACRALGNYEIRHPGGLAGYVARVNAAFCESAPAFVTIHDLDHLAANAGRRTWGDERFYHVAKIPCAPEFLVDYGHSVARVIGAMLGRPKKCLVLDLDNTLWGGVIGEDGLGGIRLGQGNPEGEAFVAFQRYIQHLACRGVLLAVCSKNDDHVAREVFEKHADMVLRLDDIACFVANWNDKASNIRDISRILNIGIDSIVFVDDNPAERALVRQLAPEVSVPEMPEDPQDYMKVIDQHRYFETTSLGEEDYSRKRYYQSNAERQQASLRSATLDDFLESLNMQAHLAPIGPDSLERSVQLINKSNQFNLTTRRYSIAQVMSLMKDDQWITRAIRLVDRFGDNGLISVVLARIAQAEIIIDTWLMSCRVLKRGVENVVMNHLYRLARDVGAKRILGEYIATPKNALVKDHYCQLGFQRAEGGEDDTHTRWELAVDGVWRPREHFIEEVVADG